MEHEDFMQISRTMGGGISAESQRNRSGIVAESFENRSKILAQA